MSNSVLSGLGPQPNVTKNHEAIFNEPVIKQHKDKLTLQREFTAWAHHLKSFVSESAAVFTLVDECSFKKVALLDVVKFIKTQGFFNDVLAINHLPNMAFIQIQFASSSKKVNFVNTCSTFGNWQMLYVSGDELIQTCNIFVNNLPANVIEEHLGPALAKFGTIDKITPTFIYNSIGVAIQLGQTKIIFRFNEGYTIEELPYFIRIWNMRVHLYIRNRRKICYRCGDFSHLISGCPYRFCGICRRNLKVGHECILSYAQMVSSQPAANNIIPLDQLEDSALADLEDSETSDNIADVSLNSVDKADLSAEPTTVQSALDNNLSQAGQCSSQVVNNVQAESGINTCLLKVEAKSTEIPSVLPAGKKKKKTKPDKTFQFITIAHL